MAELLGERMGRVDAAWFRLDRPENTADVVGLLELPRMPPITALRARIAERLLVHDRFRQIPVDRGALGCAWELDPRFDLERHLEAHRLAGGDRALARLAGEVASTPLDPRLPAWRLHVVHRPEGGALVVKVSHAVADGFALVAVLLGLADAPARRAPRAVRALPAARRLEPWLHPGAALRRALLSPAAAVRLAREAAGLAVAAARMAALPADRPTLLSRPLTGERRVAWSAGLPEAPLRAAARAAGATLNDLLVAAAAGALRTLLAAAGEPVGDLELRAMVPVNLRPGLPGPGEGLGNRFGLAFLDLPVSVASASERLARVRDRTAALKERPDAAAAWLLLAALGAAPALAGPGSRFFTRKASVVITSVPGPREPLSLVGAPIEAAVFWVPHPATLGLGLSLFSYAGRVRMGVRADVGVLPDPSRLVAAFEGELEALAGVLADAPPTGEGADQAAAPRRSPDDAGAWSP